jgi:hypothetical protein
MIKFDNCHISSCRVCVLVLTIYHFPDIILLETAVPILTALLYASIILGSDKMSTMGVYFFHSPPVHIQRD